MKTEKPNNYARDFHILTALILHLSATHWKSRTPNEIAGSLSFEPKEVERVLKAYPGFFRESKNKKENTNEGLFTVHLRYALRRKIEGEPSTDREPLSPEYISAILNLLTEMISAESEDRRLEKDLEVRKFNIKLTAFVGVSSALIGLLAGLLTGG